MEPNQKFTLESVIVRNNLLKELFYTVFVDFSLILHGEKNIKP